MRSDTDLAPDTDDTDRSGDVCQACIADGLAHCLALEMDPVSAPEVVVTIVPRTTAEIDVDSRCLPP